MKQNTETESMLKAQKAEAIKVTKEKETLLLNAPKSSDYDDIKRNLGWNDTDVSIENQTRAVIEKEHVKKTLVSENILTNEAIYDYCIKNNYVLAKITEYKGQLSEELLKAIKDYRDSADIRLESEANLNNLYLLCPFSDVVANNSDIKKSKRYKKGELPKIMLLELHGDRRIYSSDYYKVIFEIGVRKTIRNTISSIFKTHTKTQNFINNVGVIGGLSLIFLITSAFCVFDNSYAFQGLPLYIDLVMVILILKIILPSMMSVNDSPSFNYWNDNGYKNILDHTYATSNFNTSWLLSNRRFTIKNKNLVRLKVHISFYIILLATYLILSFMVKVNQMVLLNKNSGKVTLVKSVVDKNGEFDYHTIHTKDGIFSYNTKIVKYDMSDEAVEKRRKEEYDRTYK